jgi:hypothetical protein
MKVKAYKRLLQKSLNHINKTILRLDQLGLERELEIAVSIRKDIIRKAKKEGIKLSKKGMPR